jgi:hypothetical protein
MRSTVRILSTGQGWALPEAQRARGCKERGVDPGGDAKLSRGFSAGKVQITIQRAVVISAVVAYRLLDVEPDLGVESTMALGIRRDNAAGLSQQDSPTK